MAPRRESRTCCGSEAWVWGCMAGSRAAGRQGGMVPASRSLIYPFTAVDARKHGTPATEHTEITENCRVAQAPVRRVGDASHKRGRPVRVFHWPDGVRALAGAAAPLVPDGTQTHKCVWATLRKVASGQWLERTTNASTEFAEINESSVAIPRPSAFVPLCPPRPPRFCFVVPGPTAYGLPPSSKKEPAQALRAASPGRERNALTRSRLARRGRPLGGEAISCGKERVRLAPRGLVVRAARGQIRLRPVSSTAVVWALAFCAFSARTYGEIYGPRRFGADGTA